ncbi:DeoR/GlpR family DNA-binding transcription regulator [Acinetobacter sp. WZC-1]|uniref:DeoR/GlpR family DNA-binding transcription regulator n=1 Tax=Acinetobacter sp. WZC-1 TaxID=3459034 RepID=UPI00403D6E8A
MLQQERLHRIQVLLTQLQQISTERIMTELNISRETARRDMIELQVMGVARRVHGGMVSVNNPATEAPLNVRSTRYAREKRAIARAAVSRLTAGQSLFIDSGSTTAILAEELRSLSGLTIITNSLQAVLNLSMATEPDSLKHDIILLGGRVQQRPQTQGDLVIAEIHRYHADIALLSPVGVSAEYGASSFYSEEAAIAQAMIRQSRYTMILADHSKLDVISRVRYASVQDISTLITDSRATAQIAASEYRHSFPDLVIA